MTKILIVTERFVLTHSRNPCEDMMLLLYDLLNTIEFTYNILLMIAKIYIEFELIL